MITALTKADLLLALLDRRIEELAEQDAALARGLSGDRGAVALITSRSARVHDDAGWGLLLVEFRVQAARDPELNRRYAAAHRRTTAGLAAALAGVYERAGQDPPFPAGQLAELLAAIGSGAQLERAADPAALPGSFRTELLGRLLAARNAAGPDDDMITVTERGAT